MIMKEWTAKIIQFKPRPRPGLKKTMQRKKLEAIVKALRQA